MSPAAKPAKPKPPGGAPAKAPAKPGTPVADDSGGGKQPFGGKQAAPFVKGGGKGGKPAGNGAPKAS